MAGGLTIASSLAEAAQLTNFENKKYVYIDGSTAFRAYAALTKAQIQAGVDLALDVNQVTGFDETVNWIDTTNAGTGRTGKLAGRRSSGDSSIKFNNDLGGPTFDGRSIFTVIKQLGVLTIWPTGYDDSTDLYDSFAVQVGSISPDEDVEAAQSTTVSFGILRSPKRNIPMPTS